MQYKKMKLQYKKKQNSDNKKWNCATKNGIATKKNETAIIFWFKKHEITIQKNIKFTESTFSVKKCYLVIKAYKMFKHSNENAAGTRSGTQRGPDTFPRLRINILSKNPISKA